MAYDPADLRLPATLLRLFDVVVRIHLPLWPGWRLAATRPGALYAAALVGVWAAALYSGNNLLYLCGAMLLMLALAGMAVAVLLLTRLPPLAPVMPTLGEAGVPGAYQQPLSFSFAFAACVAASWGTGVVATAHCLPQGSRVQARVPPMRRGLYAFDEQRLVTEAPLGLWRLEHVRRDAWRRAVLPAPLAWTTAAAGAGLQSAPSACEGDEWRDLRAYVRGDPLSRIHWRKAAMGEWAVKRFGADSGADEAAILRVDLRGPAGDAFEQLLGRALFWMNPRESGRLVLGSQAFDLADPDARQRAYVALASAQPETTPPAGRGGILLSLAERRRAA